MNDDVRTCAAISAATFTLSVTGHVLGNGSVPAPQALVVVALLAVVTGAVTAVRRRPPSVAALAVVMAGVQTASHAVMHRMAGHPPVEPVHLVESAHHVQPGLGSTVATQAAHHAEVVAHAGHGVSPLMLTTHLLATLALAWLLGPAVRQVRAAVRRAVLTVAVPALPSPPRLEVLVLPARVTREVGACLSLRGPPRFVST